MAQKPSIPKGTRDFSPLEMTRRTYMFDTIKRAFRAYGYAPLETPAMENLSTLTGKYGEEGDKLLFKILNSGDFTRGFSDDDRRRIASAGEAAPCRWPATWCSTRPKSSFPSAATRYSPSGVPTDPRRVATASFISATWM